MPTQLVWFKRNLRIADHEPLARAAQAGPVLALYLFEPSVIHAPDYAAQHLAFTQECLEELQQALQAYGVPLHCVRGEAVHVFTQIHRLHPFEAIWSHEETGNGLTYARDQAVSAWCKAHGVRWHESPQFGVVRRLASRDGWARKWDARMAQPLIATPRTMTAAKLPQQALVSDSAPLHPAERDKEHRLRGGRVAALALLDTFLTQRGQYYQREMSSPNTAVHACSRISPYLALGCISMRETVQRLRREQDELRALPAPVRPPGFLASLRSFEGRMHWHCHFMQKLESEPRIEFENMVPGMAGLRENDFNQEWFERWQQGTTGYPMIDACMRMLNATGWLNFRMRSMLVSFASYNLWLHWRAPALHLARQFLDYEPGIHYSQMQMQSGTTGFNTLRIYSPVKQALDHDLNGTFVRRWVPELHNLPDAHLIEPWKMSAADQSRSGVRIGSDYPAPIVDWASSLKTARAKLTEFRQRSDVHMQTQQVMERHGSRKSGMKITGVRRKNVPVSSPQLSLDLFVEP